MTLGTQPIRTTGKVRGKRLEIETAAQDSRWGGSSTATPTDSTAAPTVNSPPPTRSSIAWSSDDLGPFAMEQSFLCKPMQPGERRTLKSLLVEFQQAVPIELTAKNYESTKLPSGPRELLRIETVTRLADGQKMEQTVWTDRAGEVLKTLVPIMGGLETYRVTQAEALKHSDVAPLDLLPSTMVKVEPPLRNAHRARQVCYRVHLDDGDPAKVFAVGPSQSIKPIDAHTAEVTVYAIRPGRNDGNRAAPPEVPTEDDLRPNSFVQSDDPVIVADAKKAAGDETDPWRVAVALERFVNREVKDKNFSQAFASASEVARSREGDCTEHAVFLMALCRARGIPARAAMGLVYLESQKAFFYHLWTEAYIDKRWIPIDGTQAPRRHRRRPSQNRPKQPQRRHRLQRVPARRTNPRAAEHPGRQREVRRQNLNDLAQSWKGKSNESPNQKLLADPCRRIAVGGRRRTVWRGHRRLIAGIRFHPLQSED